MSQGPFPPDPPFIPGQSFPGSAHQPAGLPEQPPGFPQPGPPPGFGQPPPGYQQFGQGMQPVNPGTNGLSVASFVLSVVTVIPCFWLFPITAVLGVIFGFVSRGQLKSNPGQRGMGLAIAGIVIGVVFILIAIAFWAWVASSDNCYRDGSSFHCVNFDN